MIPLFQMSHCFGDTEVQIENDNAAVTWYIDLGTCNVA